MKAKTFDSAEALRRKYQKDDPVRDLLADARAGIDAASSELERQALVDAAWEGAQALTVEGVELTPIELDSVRVQINELVTGPESVRWFDKDYVNPETGDPTGRYVDVATLVAENPLFAKVADAVANASTAAEAREIVMAAQQADYEAMRDGAPEEELTWSFSESLMLGVLLDDIVDDGTVPADVETVSWAEAEAGAAMMAEAKVYEAARRREAELAASLSSGTIDDEVNRFAEAAGSQSVDA